MNKTKEITPELLSKIDRAYAVSSGNMNKFKAEEPVAAALAKFNPISQEVNKGGSEKTKSNTSKAKIK